MSHTVLKVTQTDLYVRVGGFQLYQSFADLPVLLGQGHVLHSRRQRRFLQPIIQRGVINQLFMLNTVMILLIYSNCNISNTVTKTSKDSFWKPSSQARKCVRLPEKADNIIALLWESLPIGATRGVRGWRLAWPMKGGGSRTPRDQQGRLHSDF